MREFARNLTESLVEAAAEAPSRQGYGGQSMVAPLKRVLVQTPARSLSPDDAAHFGYPHAPNDDLAMSEHSAFVTLLQEQGIEVIQQDAAPDGELDSIFVYDSGYITDDGALLTRPGKVVRRGEPRYAASAFADLGISIIGEIEEPGTLEGGDMCWLDPQVLAVGESYRTNANGIDQLGVIMQAVGVDLYRVPLPHWHGEDECLHLLSLISPVAEQMAVVYLPLLPVPFVQTLRRSGWTLIETPDEEFASQGCNVLALAPRKVLMLKDNPITRTRLDAAGVETIVYTGDEISHNRAGGPTCLTRPILRDMHDEG
ncbi:MAG TPA: arginine deiminase family protein [Thermomicrobiales bacterium]|nr:arginine deiminase family protein [Thermomicrobiales bacterium]